MTNAIPKLPQALDHALMAYKEGKLIEAETLCQQIITANHDLFDAVWLLASIQLTLDKKEAALTSYDRAVALRPDAAIAHYDRAVTLQELARFDEAR